MIDVFCIRGTGEELGSDGRPTGMIKSLTDHLDRDSFDAFQVAYPATIGPAGGDPWGASLETSVAVGVANLAERIRNTNRVAGIVSYSLGSLVANEFLRRKRDGWYAELEVAFVLNIANPGRREGESVNNLADGRGVHGERALGPVHIPVIELANPGDLITSAEVGSPWERVSDGISPFALLEGFRVGGSRDFEGDPIEALKKLRANEARWQFWNPLFWSRYGRAINDGIGYLTPWPHGQHVLYSAREYPFPGTNKTWCQVGAEAINARWGQ